MGVGPSGDVARNVGRLFGAGTLAGLSDAQLLDRFLARREEAAFEALVERHGPMVLATCRRVLRDEHAAEDAFQATFLVLARRGPSVRAASSLGGWLYRVAFRIAARARAAEARRRGRERRSAEMTTPTAPERLEPDDYRVLYEELDRLPARYRDPVVLCHLEGLSNEAAAERLGCPVGTVWGRLSRARQRLRDRLVRRGIAPAVAALVAGGTQEAGAAVSPALLAETVRLGVASMAGGAGVAALARPTVDRMTRGALRAMTWERWGTTAALVTAVGVAAIGAVAWARGQGKTPPAGVAATTQKAASPARPRLPDGCEPLYQETSPDGSRVAYVGAYTPDDGRREDGLFAVELASGKVRRLLPGALRTVPAWSPDSRRVAIAETSGYGNVYPLALIDITTGAVEKTGVQGGAAAWSPDGRSIAVGTEFHQAGSWYHGIPVDGRIGVYDVEARRLTPITPPGYNLSDDRSALSAMGGSLGPLWSPDGRRIAFELMTTAGRGDATTKTHEVWVVDRDGSGLRRALPSAREVRWSADGRDLIASGGKDKPEERIDVEGLPVTRPKDWPKPPAELLAAQGASREAEARAGRFDPAPVFRRNRPWQNPPLDRLASVQFLHRMEPNRLDERFVWRRDGAMLTEVVRREDPRAAEEVGRAWVISPGREQSYFAPGARYPAVDAKDQGELVAYARDHLMGTRTRFVALDWGRDPTAFEVRDARPGDDGRTTLVELAPRPTRDRRRYGLHAGAMFETTSWAYVHDLYVGRSTLTIDAATHRILREVDYGYRGETLCEVAFSDWRDVDADQAVPLRIVLTFPGQKFTVDYRFQWRPEGLWILGEGQSKFEDQKAERESILDLKIGEPTPDLDAALERARRGQEELQRPAAIQAEARAVARHPFLLGVRIPLTGAGPLDALAFTLRGRDGGPPPEHWDHPDLRAVLTRPADAEAPAPGRDLLLVLYDAKGRPIASARGPLAPGPGPIELDLGQCRPLGPARSWSLTVLAPGQPAVAVGANPPRGGADPAPAGAPAFPARMGEEVVVEVPSGDDGKTRLRSVRLKADDGGGTIAEVELISQDHWKAFSATAAVVLLDERDTPIAAGGLTHAFRVEAGVYRAPGLAVKLGGTAGGVPRRMLVGVEAIMTGRPMGSRWGTFGDHSPPFSIDLLLAADNPSVWRRGLAALNDAVRSALGRASAYRPDQAELTPAARGEVRRVLKPHRDRLGALLREASDTDGLTLLARLAGYSGDERLREPLRRLLDHPRDDVRDAAAIGLALLGDNSGAARLRAFLDRPPPADPSASRAFAERKADAALALKSIDGAGAETKRSEP
jgi:RNA polymerase sigma factor (sigma-70 family)